MTEIEKKALALVNATFLEPHYEEWVQVPQGCVSKALIRAIEQHEAYKQEVSDAVGALKKVWGAGWNQCSEAQMCDDFIIPKPVDPLLEAVGDAMQAHEVYSKYELTDSIRAIGKARGYEWRKIGEGA